VARLFKHIESPAYPPLGCATHGKFHHQDGKTENQQEQQIN
jgi:hypothetical protein